MKRVVRVAMAGMLTVGLIGIGEVATPPAAQAATAGPVAQPASVPGIGAVMGTKTYRDRKRGLKVISGRGSKYLKGFSLENEVMWTLRKIKARNVTVRLSAYCPKLTGYSLARGYVKGNSTSTIYFCASGDLARHGNVFRNDVRFTVAHEYGHIRNHRYKNSRKLPKSVRKYMTGYQGEKLSDCQAARTTGLPIRYYGTYTKKCTGKLKYAAYRVAKMR